MTRAKWWALGGLIAAAFFGVVIYRKFHGETSADPVILTFDWGTPEVSYPAADPDIGVKPRHADNDRMNELIEQSNVLIRRND